MNRPIFWMMALATLASGCAETRQDVGATGETDQNVLTGGPFLGTRVRDLPEPVLQVLRQQVPTAEVADIEKQHWSGRLIYKVAFLVPGKNPTLYIADDGTVLQKPPL
ncbi:MAG TPA: hypothetical protein VNT26_07405 [Candidatus Sulfotelmatobacter sp.]|nr:hypothetical protein [Candidatus Sulfotelmatobacter sp.]HWI59711.1 hypothetical protein [Bacillota bacterium]